VNGSPDGAALSPHGQFEQRQHARSSPRTNDIGRTAQVRQDCVEVEQRQSQTTCDVWPTSACGPTSLDGRDQPLTAT